MPQFGQTRTRGLTRTVVAGIDAVYFWSGEEGALQWTEYLLLRNPFLPWPIRACRRFFACVARRAGIRAMQNLFLDFSGYCDNMALKIRIMFGISLPLNSQFPYKAASIIDFWRRWHLDVIGAFCATILYIPLGGSCRGTGNGGSAQPSLRLCWVSGLWHGAAWTHVRRLGRLAWNLSRRRITTGTA